MAKCRWCQDARGKQITTQGYKDKSKLQRENTDPRGLLTLLKHMLIRNHLCTKLRTHQFGRDNSNGILLLTVFSLLFGDCFSSSIHCSGSYQHDCNSKCSNHSGLWGCWHTETVSQLEEKRASSECGSKSEFIQVRSNSPGKFHQLFRNIFFKELTFSLYQWGQKMYKVLRTSQYAESILFFLLVLN